MQRKRQSHYPRGPEGGNVYELAMVIGLQKIIELTTSFYETG